MTSNNFYRLIQGDCLEILPTFSKESIQIGIVDPPYSETVAPEDSLADFKMLESFFRELFSKLSQVLKKDGYVFVFTDFRRYASVFYGLYNFLKPVNLIVWKKNFIGPGIYFRPLHELILCCVGKNNNNLHSPKNRELSDIWMAERVKTKLHPFQKPIVLMRTMIQNCSNKYDVILDPCLGSGTTMKASQDLERSCIGVEINPDYCEIVKNRCFGRRFLDREVTYQFEVFGAKEQLVEALPVEA